MTTMMSPVDKIAELFGSAGASDYLGEPVTVAARLLQSGALASAAGAARLTQWFPPPGTEPIRLHVPAKRYLCAVEPSYFGVMLSRPAGAADATLVRCGFRP